MFVPTKSVPISDENGNTIWIKPKMDFGTKSQALDEIARLKQFESPDSSLGLMIGSYQRVLMRLNIVSWEGPAFAADEGLIPCVPATIDQLDPDEPLVNKVLAEIQERNKSKKSPNPKSQESDGSTSSGAQSSTGELVLPVITTST
jgi:hypothetical protein